MIETSCSVFLFTLLFYSATTISLASIKIKASTKEMKEMTELLEVVKNSLQYNTTYEDIDGLKINNKLFINEVNMNYSTLQNKEVVSLFENCIPGSRKHIEVNIEGDKVFRIIINLKNDHLYKTKPLTMELYKGSYR